MRLTRLQLWTLFSTRLVQGNGQVVLIVVGETGARVGYSDRVIEAEKERSQHLSQTVLIAIKSIIAIVRCHAYMRKQQDASIPMGHNAPERWGRAQTELYVC